MAAAAVMAQGAALEAMARAEVEETEVLVRAAAKAAQAVAAGEVAAVVAALDCFVCSKS